VRLAQLAETHLLGIELGFNASANAWMFAQATPLPDLTVGGEPLLDALAAELFQPKVKTVS
jgi:hypothetical protein